VVALLSFPGVTTDLTVSTMPVDLTKVGIYDTRVRVPELTTRPSPRSQRLTHEIRRRTGWSNRQLARVLEISHPTVRALEEGRSRPGDTEVLARLVEVDAVVSRVFMLTGQEASETQRVLESKPLGGRQSPVELLRSRQPSVAYLAAIDVIRPPERSPLMTGIWASRAGEGTHDLSAVGLT
jgi:DNA-binding transcriptional regulator YiaG